MADLDVAVRLKFLTTGQEKLKAAAKDLAAFGKGMSGRATGRFGADLNKAWHASAKLGGSLDKSAKAAGKTATAMRAIGQTQGLDRARTSVDRLTKSTNALASAERKVRATAVVGSGGGGALAAGALGGAVASRRKAAMREGLAEAASRVSPGAGYLIGAGGAVAVGAAVGATAAAGLAVAARSTKESIDRNKAMADIQKKVNLDVGDSYEAQERRISRVSRKMGISFAEAASAFAQGASGNVATRDLEDFALLGGKLSAAWDVGAKEAAKTLTEVRAQTGWTISQLQEFGDKVNFLGDISAGAERDIASMFSRTGSAAKAAGVGFDESLVAMTALRSVGMEDSVASRFFGQFTAKLRTASRQSKDAQATFKELGLSAKAIEKGMQTKPMETMMDFLDRLAKSKDPVKHAMAFGGQQWFDEMLKFKEAAPELIRLWEAFKKGGFKGSLDKALETDLNTTTAKLQQAWQTFLTVGAEQFKGTLPLIDAAADKLKSINESYLKATETTRILGKAGKELLTPDEEKRVLGDPELRGRIEAQRRARTGTGESLAAYEARLGLNRPAKTPAPMFAQIEGAAPHMNLQKIDAAKADIVAKAAEMEKALSFSATPTVNTGAAMAQLDALLAKARVVKTEISSTAFSVPSGVRVMPNLTGGPRGGGSTGGGSAPATPGKQSSLGRGGGVQIATAHFHGVKDARAMHRQLAALDRRIRSARDNALHDVG